MSIQDDGIFGYGCMRLPVLNDDDQTSFNFEKINTLFDAYLSKGFRYFDTAYIYHNYKSEIAVRECLTKRHPRESFSLGTKMPMRDVQKAEDVPAFFAEQLEKCGVEYFDYYLLHNVGRHIWKKITEYNVFEFAAKKKEEGYIKYLGFSFHDTPEFLEEVLARYAHLLDFVQLQINYLDMDQANIKGRACLEVANRYNLPVIVMEPCKGGTLINLPEEALALMKEYAPDSKPAEWAFRFAASQPGVTRVLSGMNEMSQVEENCATFTDFKPLNEEEYEILKKVVAILNAQTSIQCTGCAYCVHGCPKKIAIPQYFAAYNSIQKDTGAALGQYLFYNNVVSCGNGKASECIKCGKCEKACPQHLPIREYLKDVEDTFEKDGWKKHRWMGAPPK
ncbi:MAG: aldo/keto reductase [Lachnospiraceae bacterium]|nr:aldo/keto reductase [Lachnospiraceae bacterium]